MSVNFHTSVWENESVWTKFCEFEKIFLGRMGENGKIVFKSSCTRTNMTSVHLIITLKKTEFSVPSNNAKQSLFSRSCWICKILQDPTRFCNILHDSSKFYKNLQESSRSCKILQESVRFCKFLQESTKFCKIPKIL